MEMHRDASTHRHQPHFANTSGGMMAEQQRAMARGPVGARGATVPPRHYQYFI
jgi:hypothetical protein